MEKRILLLCCVLMLCIFPAKIAAAEETTTCEEVIQEIVGAMNDRDWEAYLTHLEESKRDWMQNHYFAELTEESMGINQVTGAQLRDAWILDYADFCWDISYNEYDIYEEVGDENIFGYLVGIDYDVTTESVYFYQGLNYNLWIFAFDGRDYKLVEFTIPRIDLIEKYVTAKNSQSLLSEEEQKALDAAESRAHGNPVNLEGVSLWSDLPTIGEKVMMIQMVLEQQARTPLLLVLLLLTTCV